MLLRVIKQHNKAVEMCSDRAHLKSHDKSPRRAANPTGSARVLNALSLTTPAVARVFSYAHLHPILASLEHVKGGFSVFRRFRLTHLEKSDCPDALKHRWSGRAEACF